MDEILKATIIRAHNGYIIIILSHLNETENEDVWIAEDYSKALERIKSYC